MKLVHIQMYRYNDATANCGCTDFKLLLFMTGFSPTSD